MDVRTLGVNQCDLASRGPGRRQLDVDRVWPSEGRRDLDLPPHLAARPIQGRRAAQAEALTERPGWERRRRGLVWSSQDRRVTVQAAGDCVAGRGVGKERGG